MKVILISHDSDLLSTCREILTKYEDLDWRLTKSEPGTTPAAADLYIWDGASAIDRNLEIERPFSRHLFLLHQREVAEFQENLGAAGAPILLKPVTQACLAAFMEFAASAFQDRTATVHSLRSDRDEMLQCLIQTNLQLQQYEQDRTNFLTRAVHDFRAPLTATGGYCGLLLDGALGPLTEEQKEVLGRMRQSVKRLSRMASAMFELGVGRQLKRRPDLRPADVRERVEQALHEITQAADSKNISISVELVPEEGKAYLEPGQIEQVLMNLLDNACKFTPKGGTIEIRGYPFFWERRAAHSSSALVTDRRYRDSHAPNSYRIDIRDSGPQIPVEHIGKIFEEYTSYVGSQDRSGGGLGLAICRMIIQAHEGRVWMENTDYGPRFSFVLPIYSAKSAGPRIEDAIQLTVSEAR
ncbi:MAG: HAMP domain-containing sensor histidine kinase [Terracidiphilus sp.]|jgi:signal transduction histidine kinase